MSFYASQKPKVKQNIAVYSLDTYSDVSHITQLTERIQQHFKILRGLDIKGFLISLADIESFDTPTIEALIKVLVNFQKELKIVVGLTDYNTELFYTLLPYVKQTSLGLFENHETMALALKTSNVSNQSNVLVYSDDMNNYQLITSVLIQNHYFVVRAHSIADVKNKLKNKHLYDRVITHSYFGFLGDTVNVHFEKETFIYAFTGELNNLLEKQIDYEDLEYRLSIEHRLFVFDLFRVFRLDIHAFKTLIKMGKLALSKGARVFLIYPQEYKFSDEMKKELTKYKIDSISTIDDVLKDKEAQKLAFKRKELFISDLSTQTVKIAPKIIVSTIQTLTTYEFSNIKKTPTKLLELQDLSELRPMISTGISFDGDFDGDFIFLFTDTMSALLIEKILGGFEDKGEDFLDAMSEFCISICAKLKSNLHVKQHCIHFKEPKTSSILSELIPISSYDKPSILMSFSCEEHDFYIALTSPLVWFDESVSL